MKSIRDVLHVNAESDDLNITPTQDLSPCFVNLMLSYRFCHRSCRQSTQQLYLCLQERLRRHPSSGTFIIRSSICLTFIGFQRFKKSITTDSFRLHPSVQRWFPYKVNIITNVLSCSFHLAEICWPNQNIQSKFVLLRSENRQNVFEWLAVLCPQMRKSSEMISTISGVYEWRIFPS